MGVVVNVYHGTNEKFDNFNFSKVGKVNGIDAGFGLYFTESEAESLTYGENIFECVLTLKNGIHNEKITLSTNNIERILDELFQQKRLNYYQNQDDIEYNIISNLIKSSDSDTEIISDIINATGSVHDVLEILSYLGYTHTIDEKTPLDETITHYIIYDLNAIQIINKYTLETR